MLFIGHFSFDTRIQFSEGAFPASVSHSLPNVIGKEAEVYGFAPDVENQEMLDNGGYVVSEPFITFES